MNLNTQNGLVEFTSSDYRYSNFEPCYEQNHLLFIQRITEIQQRNESIETHIDWHALQIQRRANVGEIFSTQQRVEKISEPTGTNGRTLPHRALMGS